MDLRGRGRMGPPGPRPPERLLRPVARRKGTPAARAGTQGHDSHRRRRRPGSQGPDHVPGVPRPLRLPLSHDRARGHADDGQFRNRAMTTRMVVALLAALAAGGCSGSDDESPAAPSRSPAATPPDRVALIREEHLPNVELVTHEGRVVHFYDDLVKGRVVAINFMFSTCRNACPEATRHLLAVQQALGDSVGRDVSFLWISLERVRD